MNCQEFENSFEALARGALSDAGARAEALAHEKACAPCAARLADERALTGGLRALASGMKDVQAPARVEDALLAAFRARAAAPAVVEPTQTKEVVNVVPFAPRAEAGRAEAPRVEVRRWSWAKTAAVASLAAAASLALFVLVQTRTVVNRQGAPSPSVEVAGRGQQSEKQSQKQSANQSEGQSENQSAMIEPPPPVGSGVQPEIDEGKPSRASSAPTRARAVNASNNGGGRGLRQGGGRAGEAAAQEVATEFIPLMQGAEYASAEESHLVRVELPRTALASFGLPVNAEAPTGRVKADVLLGEDGIARAIRFVR